jgi:two-component system sensor histidine kinase/response regulator
MHANCDKLVLVVEDDETLRLLVSKQLSRLGYESDTACDGLEAVKKFAVGKYCLILMDVQMPKFDGLEATRAIRESERKVGSSPLPIVALTANPDRGLCLESGMNDFLFKPVMVESLKLLLGRLIPEPELSKTEGKESHLKSSSSIP